MRCICCGLKISEGFHPTKYGNVCDRCWNDPNLFFPERIKESDHQEFIFDIYVSDLDSKESLFLPVMRLKQNEITLYTGKLNSRNLLKLYAILGFEEETLTGYQRELYEGQTKEIADYLLNCPAPIMPGLFISIREGARFKPFEKKYNADFGELEVPLKKGALWVIDGQHRIGGFENIISNFDFINENDQLSDAIKKLLDFEIPITFLDSRQAIEIIHDVENLSLKYSDIERLVFFIINKTQRRLSPSLKDTLQYVISEAGIEGIPTIEKESWRTEAAAIGIDLNALEESPLFKKINISGQRGLGRPMQLNSFVSSQRPLLQNKTYSHLSIEKKKEFLLKYWGAIKKINEDAFSDGKYRNYLLLKAIGIYTLNFLAVDYINLCNEMNLDFIEESNILKFVNKMKGFNWTKESSPLTGLGGMKGVREARKNLIDYITNNKK